MGNYNCKCEFVFKLCQVRGIDFPDGINEEIPQFAHEKFTCNKKKISEKKKQIINSLREFAQQIKLFVCMTDGRRHLPLYCHRHQSINQQGKKKCQK